MKILFSILLFFVAFPMSALASPVFASEDNTAINGYDTVAYFTEQEAIKGVKDHTYEWNGATWRFVSKQHLEAFRNNPEKYAPQYGGYCAWGLAAKNKLFPIDPESWKVVAGKLYLNYDAKVQERWLANTSHFISKADSNWPSHLNEKH